MNSNNTLHGSLGFALGLLVAGTQALAQDKVLRADYRQRPLK